MWQCGQQASILPQELHVTTSFSLTIFPTNCLVATLSGRIVFLVFGEKRLRTSHSNYSFDAVRCLHTTKCKRYRSHTTARPVSSFTQRENGSKVSCLVKPSPINLLLIPVGTLYFRSLNSIQLKVKVVLCPIDPCVVIRQFVTVRRRRLRRRRLVKVHSINFMIFIKRNIFFFRYSLVRNKWRQLYAIISPGRWLTVCECMFEYHYVYGNAEQLCSCFYCYRARFWINYIFLLDVPILLLPNNTGRRPEILWRQEKNWISQFNYRHFEQIVIHGIGSQILIVAISQCDSRYFGGWVLSVAMSHRNNVYQRRWIMASALYWSESDEEKEEMCKVYAGTGH